MCQFNYLASQKNSRGTDEGRWSGISPSLTQVNVRGQISCIFYLLKDKFGQVANISEKWGWGGVGGCPVRSTHFRLLKTERETCLSTPCPLAARSVGRELACCHFRQGGGLPFGHSPHHSFHFGSHPGLRQVCNPAALNTHLFWEQGLEPALMQVSAGLRMTTRWRPRVGDWLEAARWGPGREGKPSPTPVSLLGADLCTFPLCIRVPGAKGPGGPGPEEAFL